MDFLAKVANMRAGGATKKPGLISGRKNAPRQGTNVATETGKGHFAAAAQKVAKLRSGLLQHGVPKHAPVGAGAIGGSKRPANSKRVHASEGQTALNPEQQGPTNKKAQTDGSHGADTDVERRD